MRFLPTLTICAHEACSSRSLMHYVLGYQQYEIFKRLIGQHSHGISRWRCQWQQEFLDECDLWAPGAVRSHLINKYLRVRCIYCRTALTSTSTPSTSGHQKVYCREVRSCSACGWWQAEELLKLNTTRDANYWHNINLGPSLGSFANTVVASALLRKYDAFAADIPIAELNVWLSKRPEYLASVDPFLFEDLIRSVFEQCYPDCEVVKIGGRKDRGIDILLVRDGIRDQLVQVKRRTKLDAREGVSAVRELNGVLFREGIARGMVITTAKEFTRDARAETRISSNALVGPFERYSMSLLAFNDLIDLLRISASRLPSPWEKFFQRREHMGNEP